mmetsp:Transcript_47841/g.135132  ORF Transcript_47841/g.135132 Transcript_47841/m.135132 type:complete len:288 (-) Transcript_47841:159-1022(-)
MEGVHHVVRHCHRRCGCFLDVLAVRRSANDYDRLRVHFPDALDDRIGVGLHLAPGHPVRLVAYLVDHVGLVPVLLGYHGPELEGVGLGGSLPCQPVVRVAGIQYVPVYDDVDAQLLAPLDDVPDEYQHRRVCRVAVLAHVHRGPEEGDAPVPRQVREGVPGVAFMEPLQAVRRQADQPHGPAVLVGKLQTSKFQLAVLGDEACVHNHGRAWDWPGRCPCRGRSCHARRSRRRRERLRRHRRRGSWCRRRLRGRWRWRRWCGGLHGRLLHRRMASGAALTPCRGRCAS